MRRANDTGNILGRLEAVVSELERSVLPKRNGYGQTFRSERLSPLVKELGSLVKLGIDSGLFEPDVVTLEFYQTFGAQVGVVYQSSASGRNDDVWDVELQQCPGCQADLLHCQSHRTGATHIKPGDALS